MEILITDPYLMARELMRLARLVVELERRLDALEKKVE